MHPSYGPITFRLHVEGAGADINVWPVFRGEQLGNPLDQTANLDLEKMTSATFDFVAPAYSIADDSVSHWEIQVHQKNLTRKVRIQHVSLRIVQECLSAEYSTFAVASESEFYRLTANNFISSSSTMGNSGVGPMLSSFLSVANGMKFTTKDSITIDMAMTPIVQQSTQEAGGMMLVI